jgi:hypothetical protein
VTPNAERKTQNGLPRATMLKKYRAADGIKSGGMGIDITAEKSCYSNLMERGTTRKILQYTV